MDEYKTSNSDSFNKRHYRGLILSKLDVDDDLVDDIQDQSDFIDENEKNSQVENIIYNIEEAVSFNKENDIHLLISELNVYLSNNEFPSHDLFQNSNIIPILIDQLPINIHNYLDDIKRISIRCLHKIILNSIELESIAINNEIIPQLNIILRFPVTPTTEYALCILNNIFVDKKEYISVLIDYFTPIMILNLLIKETKYEKGYARLVAMKIRENIKPKIFQLFLQYSTINLSDEYFHTILDFFDSLIFQQKEEENELFYISVLRGIRGISTLFLTNKKNSEYLQNKLFDILNTILKALNFFQKMNNFDALSEFIELTSSMVFLVEEFDDKQISFIIQFILNLISDQNKFKILKMNSFNFFNVIIEKNIISNRYDLFFENDIIGLLCDSIENDSFDVVCEAFSVLTNLIKTVDSELIQLLLSEETFQSILKLIQCGNQNYIADSISSFLILYDKSQIFGFLDQFLDSFSQIESEISELFESESEFEFLPTEIFDHFLEILDLVKQD